MVVLLVFLSWTLALSAHKSGKDRGARVWMVFFSASDCPNCESARALIQGLRGVYPVRVKKFIVDRPRDYALLERLEAIHGEEKFAVPLIIVGESILIGEDEITRKLERTVRRLSRSGGAPLPFLGPVDVKAPKRRTASYDCDCDRGRPPTLGEEWEKIKNFLDRLF